MSLNREHKIILEHDLNDAIGLLIHIENRIHSIDIQELATLIVKLNTMCGTIQNTVLQALIQQEPLNHEDAANES
jgi:hypothetical protein